MFRVKKILPALFPLFFFDNEPGDGAGGGGGAPAGEDATDRVSRATDFWKNSVKEEDAAAGKDAGAGGDGGAASAAGGDDAAKAAADKKAADDKAAADKAAADAAAAAGDDAKLPYFNDKRFQEIYKERGEQKAQLDAFQKLFTEGAYKIDSTETLQGVLADSFMLYDIAAGKKHPGELLDVLKTNWTKEETAKVLQGLADYCLKNGVKPDEKAANSEPWRKEIDDLKAKDAAREKAAADEKVVAERMKTVDKVMSKVEELCVAQGFDPKNADDKAEIEEYCVAVAAEAGKNKKVLEQLAKGQFGELERIFTEYHNKLVARAQRLGDRTLAAKKAKDKTLPKQPAGGAPPAKTAGKEKRDLSTADGRLAAAREEWKKTAPATN